MYAELVGVYAELGFMRPELVGVYAVLVGVYAPLVGKYAPLEGMYAELGGFRPYAGRPVCVIGSNAGSPGIAPGIAAGASIGGMPWSSVGGEGAGACAPLMPLSKSGPNALFALVKPVALVVDRPLLKPSESLPVLLPLPAAGTSKGVTVAPATPVFRL